MMTVQEVLEKVNQLGNLYKLEGEEGDDVDYIHIETTNPKIRQKLLGSLTSSGMFIQNDHPDAPCLEMSDIMFIHFLYTNLIGAFGSHFRFDAFFALLPKLESF